MSYDERIAIVGAGPVGLTTALTLARQGVPCAVFESADEIAREQRGAAFHPPTLEIFRKLGIEAALTKMGIRIPVWQMRDRSAGVYAEFDLGTLSTLTDFPFRFHLPQHYLSTLLIEVLRTLPHVDLRFGESLDSVSTDGASATLNLRTAQGAREVKMPWVVGADGARSTVRKRGGFGFEGFTWREKFLVTNVAMPMETLGYTGTAYVSDPEHWAVVLKLYDDARPDLWRVAMPADPDVDDAVLLAPANVQARLRETLGVDMDFPLAYSGTYRVHQRVADTFVKGRILLAGDAAHINNPIGGFGLNGGVHDAFNLGTKLAEVWHGRAGAELLDLYSRQRRTVAVEVVQKNSIRNKKAMEERDPQVRRRNQQAMHAISLDPDKSREFLLDSSMIASIRRADAIA
ncbi:FAD-dependent oxidoreductase [Cupriavidus sp. D39]|uniref:FAD-dependent oxidoreductase n=1 Tax=Cupriavidus sp. D39 TaxID=2997877 RepID=UPI002270AD73|nr:FAD-dependent oxidoreductase [Cupriavidus sp. D39]MCY0854867.1 FAD-dependent oxidoreductase [Cupriavidus sp. D39]